MQIVSSKFSFVDFNDPPQSCNEEVMNIPAVNDFAIKFQFIVLDATGGIDLWVVPFVGGVAITDAKIEATVICGVLAKKFYHASVPAVDLAPYVAMYNCFQYAVYDGDPTDGDSELLALRNPFEAVPASCWLSKMAYWCKENYADFFYSDTVLTNTVWLYMHLRSPTNPTKEVRYIESSGRRRLLSSTLDEDYELKTEALTQWLHRKIECALVHDYTMFTNSNVGIVEEVLSKNANYTKDWPDDVPGINIAPAKCRLIKNLTYTNSNCGETDCICTEPPTPIGYLFNAYKNETIYKPAGTLMVGQTSDGTLSIIPITYATTHGTITLNADGSFVYVPTTGYIGDDFFSYSIQNECGSNIGTIQINLKEMEAGMIMEWGGLVGAIPDGWLLCDHSAVSRTTYAPLFAAIGVLHGAGNGTTTFNLPNIVKRVPVGFDALTATYDTVGATGGADSLTQAVNQMPKHRVKIFKEADAVSLNESWPAAPRAVARKNTTEPENPEYRLDPAAAGEADTGDSSEVGGDVPMDIRNAFVVIPYIIKT